MPSGLFLCFLALAPSLAPSLALASDSVSSAAPAPMDGFASGSSYLLPCSVMAGDIFGCEVDLSGDIAVVGAAYADTAAGVDAGAAYVFRWNPGTSRWECEATLAPADATAGDQFGIVVAIDGQTIVVGANLDSHSSKTHAGSAYIFRPDGPAGSWIQIQKLLDPSPQDEAKFGEAVAIEGGLLAVGALGDIIDGQVNAGSVTVFEESGGLWVPTDTLVGDPAPGGVDNDFFGEEVAISGDRIVVGASRGDAPGLNACGAAYVFDRGVPPYPHWVAKLVHDDAGDGDFGGESVDVDSNRIVLGAWHHDGIGGTESGAAYVFDFDGTDWVQTAKLEHCNAEPLDHSGHNVSVQGDVALVVNYNDDVGGIVNRGSVSVYRKVTGVWIEDMLLTDPAGATVDNFGSDVAMQGSVVIVGIQQSDLLATDGGAAMALDLDEEGDWTDLGYALAGSSGTPQLSGYGHMEGNCQVMLVLENALPAPGSPTVGHIVMGFTAIYAPFKCGVFVPNKDFLASLPLDPSGGWVIDTIWPPGVPVGFTTYYQVWIKDAGGPCGFAASNALEGMAR